MGDSECISSGVDVTISVVCDCIGCSLMHSSTVVLWMNELVRIGCDTCGVGVGGVFIDVDFFENIVVS